MKKKKSSTEQSGHTPHLRGDEAHREATEPDRIRELTRPDAAPRDEDEFVTDAELEAREIDRESDEG